MIDAVRETLTSGRLAHLHTTNADGSPQVSIVWTSVSPPGDVIHITPRRLGGVGPWAD